MRIAVLAAAIAALACGCASIKVSRVGGRTIAVVENSGWYLFDCIPIASGNPKNPNGCLCKFFSDTVTLESNMELLQEAVRREGATGCKSISSYTTEENVFVVLLGRLYFHTTAELTMPEGKE